MRRLIAFLFVAALMVAAPASAQDQAVNVNLGGGYTFALSEVREHLGDGYNINFGLWFNVTPTIAIQVEYSYNGLGKKQINIPPDLVPPGATQSDVFADMNMQYGNFNLVFKPPTESKAKPYIIAGAGVYYRPVKVTTPVIGYVPPYCDPWWYYCWPGGFVEVDQILASESTTGFGIDFGGGITFQASDAVGIYIEARYHYIWGPELKDNSGKSYGKANGQFLPITFGLRF